MSKTSIEWTEFSVNPIRYRNLETGKVGHYCEKVSAGCKNCYSSQMQKGPYLSGLEFVASNKGKGEHFFEPKVIEQIIARRKPTEYFWCDMTDLFGDWVPTAWIAKCFAAMALTQQHTHITLTKRPQRMCELVNMSDFEALVSGAVADLVATTDALGSLNSWPPPNWVAGTSCENQPAADERIPWLLQTQAATRCLSLEPLLGPIDLEQYLWASGSDTSVYCDRNGHRRSGGAGGQTITSTPLNAIHSVICGGESGPNARPCSVNDIRSIVRQCSAAGTKCFVKQLGSNYVDAENAVGGYQTRAPEEYTRGPIKNLKDRKGADMSEWPSDLQVRELPWRIQS